MTREKNRWGGFKRHLGIAIFANLLASLVSIAFFLIVNVYDKTISEQPTSKIIASVGAILFWCISYGLVVLLVRKGKTLRKNLKYIGYYFPLTTMFVWAFEQRNLRLKAKEQLARLERIVEGWPNVRIVAGIIDPEKQEEALNEIIDKMDSIEDRILGLILENIQRYSENILASVGESGNYDLFRQLMEKVSLSETDARPETYTYFLWFLSDIFSMPPKGCFTRQVQNDMIGPLKKAIWRADRSHLNRVAKIIGQIMADEEHEHYLARQILEMLLSLDPKKNREVWQIIFDNSIKRAFLFPQDFGLDLLLKLGELKHKVFWLDIQSLRSILEQAVKNSEKALINLKRKAYDALCSTVFSPLEFEENEGHAGIRSGRVFRRLSGVAGQVQVECKLPDGNLCTCEAQSLSLRGLYSKKCTRKVGEKMKAKLMPIVEVGEPQPKHEFVLSASVAETQHVEGSKQIQGRGIFFVDAEKDVVKSLYEYISEHHK